ncbi:MBG domain-containing protein [Pseudomonas aeruginosa]
MLNGGGLVRVSGENVGNYAIQQGGLGLVSGNYDLAYQGNNLTITKALLNVIADGRPLAQPVARHRRQPTTAARRVAAAGCAGAPADPLRMEPGPARVRGAGHLAAAFRGAGTPWRHG